MIVPSPDVLAKIAQQNLTPKNNNGGNKNMTNWHGNQYAYGNYYTDRKKHRLTDFELLTYKAVFENKSSRILNDAHNSIGFDILNFIRGLGFTEMSEEELFRKCKGYGIALMNSPFTDDGQIVTDWSQVHTLVEEGRVRRAAEIAAAEAAKPPVPDYAGPDHEYSRHWPWDGPEEDEYEYDESISVFNAEANTAHREMVLIREVNGITYNLDWFIDYLGKIPVDKWTTGVYEDGEQKDVFGHLGCKMEDGKEIFTAAADAFVGIFDDDGRFNGWNVITRICDGRDPWYAQDNPKERIISALNDIKNRSK